MQHQRHPSRPREPIFNVPAAVVLSIAVLAGIHAVRSLLPLVEDFDLVLTFGFIPARWTVAWDPARLADVLRDAGAAASGPGAGADMLELARYILGEGEPGLWTAGTYALLHGSWPHLLLNVFWLAAFGTPVARRCGPWRFAVLAIAAALAGAIVHLAVHPTSIMPMIGASAAVSGMMAAAARFAFADPWQSGFRYAPQPHERPRQGLSELIANKRVVLFIAIWFAINLVFGLAAVPLGLADGGIAWEAHIGGFLVGLFLFPLIDPV